MKWWTIVGIYSDRRSLTGVEKLFLQGQKARSAAQAERDFLANRSHARIAAVFEGDHVSSLSVDVKLLPEASAATFGAQGWTMIGIDQKTRLRFVLFSPGASLDVAKDACCSLYGRDSKILAAIAGNLEPVDAERGPITLNEKTWTVCGVWELGDKPEPFTDTIVAETAEEAESLIGEKQPTLTIAGIFEGDHEPRDAGPETKSKTTTAWTVVGVLQGNGQRFAENVEAASWMAARDMCEVSRNDLVTAAVFEGKLEAADTRLAPAAAGMAPS